MLQNLKKVLKSKIFNFFSFLRHEVPFKASNNRKAIVACARHVMKRPSKRSVLVATKSLLYITFSVNWDKRPETKVSQLSGVYTKRTKVFVHVQTMPHGRNMHAT